MVLICLPLILDLLNIIYSYECKDSNILYNNLKNEYFLSCFDKSITEQLFYKEDLICLFHLFKKAPNETLDDILYVLKNYNGFKNLIEVFFVKNNISFLYDIIDDIIVNKSNKIINYTCNIIRGPHSSMIFGKLINILNTTNFTFNNLFGNLSEIFKVTEIEELFNYTYEKYKNNIVDIIEVITRNTSFSEVFQITKKFLSKYQDDLIRLIYNLIVNYPNGENITKILRDFIIKFNNNSYDNNILNDLEELETNHSLFKNLSEIINLDGPIADKIFKEILRYHDLMIYAIRFLKNNTFVGNVSEIILNLGNKTYVTNELPKLIRMAYSVNEKYYKLFLDAVVTIAGNLVKDDDYKGFVGKDLSKKLRDFLFDGGTRINETISHSCIYLLKYTFFDNYTESISKFRYFYIKKLLVETSKDKNNFLLYENCLSGDYNFNASKNFSMKPVFLIGIVKDKENTKKFKNSTLFEKYNYLLSLCLPYGINKDTQEDLCSIKDYGNAIKMFSELVHNMSTSSVETLILNDETIKVKKMDYGYFAISVFIMIFPLIIKFFLKISEFIIKKKHKSEIFNKLINVKDDESDNPMKETQINITKEKQKNVSFLFPKWFLFLNEYFDITHNGKELFKFSANETNFYNFNGITYIKGILGLSLILNVFGQTFFILSNLPHKTMETYQFYETVFSPFYFIIFIGLRYAPRLIFSCSGYTLIYKFLFFIESESSFYFLKFLFLHGYKYILLICISLFMRYSLYYLNFIIKGKRNPIFEVFKHNLEKNDKNYFLNLLTLMFYNLNKSEYENNESVIQYLYIPINEIFFFIFGIALISIGYKFKIRIDRIIIFFILIIYLAKIFLYFFYFHQNELYPTLYYYLFGYGALMLNSLFNLPSFLIGMYFGLVNFTIQRGVNVSFKEIGYKKMESFKNFKAITQKGNFENNLSINDSSEEDNLMLNKILTFNNKTKLPLYKNNDVLERCSASYEVEEENNKEKENLYIKSENKIIKEMPFLKSTICFNNFHRRTSYKKCLITIFIFFALIILCLIFIKYIYLNNISDDKDIKIIELSFGKIIPDYILNIIYILDIELVVFMINWICLYAYFKGGEFNDFLSHIYWSFFSKSYFSYALVSSPIILYLFYQSETFIKVTIYNIFLYSSINLIFVFISVIIFYSFYEYPLRKIFKTIKIRKSNINLAEEEFDEDDDDNYTVKA